VSSVLRLWSSSVVSSCDVRCSLRTSLETRAGSTIGRSRSLNIACRRYAAQSTNHQQVLVPHFRLPVSHPDPSVPQKHPTKTAPMVTSCFTGHAAFDAGEEREPMRESRHRVPPPRSHLWALVLNTVISRGERQEMKLLLGVLAAITLVLGSSPLKAQTDKARLFAHLDSWGKAVRTRAVDVANGRLGAP